MKQNFLKETDVENQQFSQYKVDEKAYRALNELNLSCDGFNNLIDVKKTPNLKLFLVEFDKFIKLVCLFKLDEILI